MKWIVLFFCLLLPIASAENGLILYTGQEKKPAPAAPVIQSCSKQDLYVIAWTIHVPDERHKAMLKWFDENTCNSQDYTTIWNALPELAGTSDSALLRAKIIKGYEKALKGEASGK